jgi:hypothetical protein
MAFTAGGQDCRESPSPPDGRRRWPVAFRTRRSPRQTRDGRLSPDGRFLAYASNESGVSEISVRTFPEVKAGKWVISSGGGQQPIWSRDGRELFYRTEDGTVMAVPINASPSFSYGSPVRLINPPLTLHAADTAPTYDVSPDGRRFMFIRAPELDICSLEIIQNWDVHVKATVEGTWPY